jgi:hypothetical protein
MKGAISQIIDSMNNEPDRWRFAYLTFDGPGGVSVWQSDFMGVYTPEGITCGPINLIRLWRAKNLLRRRLLAKRLAPPSPEAGAE